MKLRYYMRGLGIGILVTAVLMSITIHGKTEKLSDAQIIARAKELGMEEKYDSSVLADSVSDDGISENGTKITKNNVADNKENTDISEKTKQEKVSQDDPKETTEINESQIDNAEEAVDQNQTDKAENQTQTDQAENQDKTEEQNQIDKTEKKDQTDKAEEQNQTDKADKQNQSENKSDEILNIEITVNSGDGSDSVARKLKESGLIEDARAYDRFLCANGYDKKICVGKHVIPSGSSDEEIAKILTSKQ